MGELLKNTLKLFFRRKSLFFWTFIFPLVLATLFFVAIKPIYGGDVLEEPIKVAIVDESKNDEFKYFDDMLETLEYKDDMKLISSTNTSYEDALALMENKEVAAIYIVKDDVQIETKAMNTSVYILEAVATSYNQHQTMFMNAIETKGFEAAVASFQDGFSIQLHEIELKNNDSMSLQYYSIFGMSCFYSAYWGMQTSVDSEGNQSPVGARKMLAPTSKIKVMFADYILSFGVSFVSQVIVFAYMHFVLGMAISDYGGWMLLLIAMGCLAGISWGKIVSTAFDVKESLKIGILTTIPLIGSMLSGMMSIDMRRLPFAQVANHFNPMNWVSEGMYSLYVYGINDQYLKNLISLLIFTIVAFVLSLILGRRKQYESL